MARTLLEAEDIANGALTRALMNTSTAGSAVITKVIVGTGIAISNTGVDAGTGDVTVGLAAGAAASNLGLSGALGSGVAAALVIATGSAGSHVVNGGALGTPSGGVLTNCTGLPVGSISGFGAGVAAAAAIALNSGGGLVGYSSLASGAFSAAYTLPAATSTTLGGVKPDGATILNSSGALSVAYGAAANTAAQGNDSRITGALQTSSLGSGVAAALGTGVTGSGALVLSASPTFTGTVNAAAIAANGALSVGGLLTQSVSSATGTSSASTAQVLETRRAGPLTQTVGYDINFGGPTAATGSNQSMLNVHLQQSSVGSGWAHTAYGLSFDVDATVGAGGSLWFSDNCIGINTATPTANLTVNGTSLLSGQATISSTAASTSTTTGALVVDGGVGVAGALNVGGALSGNGSGLTALSAANTNVTAAGTGGVSRTVAAKLGDSVSVLDFGADPTGVGYSYTAFVNAASAGKTVRVPAGTYKLETVFRIPANVILDMDANAVLVPAANNSVLQLSAGSKVLGGQIKTTGVSGWNSSAILIDGSDYSGSNPFLMSTSTQVLGTRLYGAIGVGNGWAVRFDATTSSTARIMGVEIDVRVWGFEIGAYMLVTTGGNAFITACKVKMMCDESWRSIYCVDPTYYNISGCEFWVQHQPDPGVTVPSIYITGELNVVFVWPWDWNTVAATSPYAVQLAANAQNNEIICMQGMAYIYDGSGATTNTIRAMDQTIVGKTSLFKGTLYPPYPNNSTQTNAAIWAGGGVPSNTMGANGDFYFNSGGGAGSCIYQKRAGVWYATNA